jgi:hypothetical protein
MEVDYDTKIGMRNEREAKRYDKGKHHRITIFRMRISSTVLKV